MPVACPHPPARLYSWFARDRDGDVLCIACCDCGAVLRGGASLHEAAAQSDEE